MVPAKEITRIAHTRGIPVLFDGAQAAVHLGLGRLSSDEACPYQLDLVSHCENSILYVTDPAAAAALLGAARGLLVADDLTGLANHRVFWERLRDEVARARQDLVLDFPDRRLAHRRVDPAAVLQHLAEDGHAHAIGAQLPARPDQVVERVHLVVAHAVGIAARKASEGTLHVVGGDASIGPLVAISAQDA